MVAGIQRALLGQENALHTAITVFMTEFKLAVHAIEAALKEKWVFFKRTNLSLPLCITS